MADASTPSLGSATPLNGTYILIMVDPDVYINGTHIPVVQWMQSGLTTAPNPITSSYPLTANNVSALAAYYPPSPLATPAIVHRYTAMLFKEPANFSAEIAGFPGYSSVTSRTEFNLTGFINMYDLGEIIAANWFDVISPNATNATTSASGTGTSATSTGSPVVSNGGSRIPGNLIVALLAALPVALLVCM